MHKLGDDAKNTYQAFLSSSEHGKTTTLLLDTRSTTRFHAIKMQTPLTLQQIPSSYTLQTQNNHFLALKNTLHITSSKEVKFSIPYIHVTLTFESTMLTAKSGSTVVTCEMNEKINPFTFVEKLLQKTTVALNHTVSNHPTIDTTTMPSDQNAVYILYTTDNGRSSGVPHLPGGLLRHSDHQSVLKMNYRGELTRATAIQLARLLVQHCKVTTETLLAVEATDPIDRARLAVTFKFSPLAASGEPVDSRAFLCGIQREELVCLYPKLVLRRPIMTSQSDRVLTIYNKAKTQHTKLTLGTLDTVAPFAIDSEVFVTLSTGGILYANGIRAHIIKSSAPPLGRYLVASISEQLDTRRWKRCGFKSEAPLHKISDKNICRAIVSGTPLTDAQLSKLSRSNITTDAQLQVNQAVYESLPVTMLRLTRDNHAICSLSIAASLELQEETAFHDEFDIIQIYDKTYASLKPMRRVKMSPTENKTAALTMNKADNFLAFDDEQRALVTNGTVIQSGGRNFRCGPAFPIDLESESLLSLCIDHRAIYAYKYETDTAKDALKFWMLRPMPSLLEARTLLGFAQQRGEVLFSSYTKDDASVVSSVAFSDSRSSVPSDTRSDSSSVRSSISSGPIPRHRSDRISALS